MWPAAHWRFLLTRCAIIKLIYTFYLLTCLCRPSTLGYALVYARPYGSCECDNSNATSGEWTCKSLRWPAKRIETPESDLIFIGSHYLRRRLCFNFGLFVCLSVRRITEKVVNGFWRIFLESWVWPIDQLIIFWWRSASLSGSGSPFRITIRIWEELAFGGGLCSLRTSSWLLLS